ncbi:MAG: hypothetical protein KGH61_03440 [Candidatus Micrarchaeota archaeon]|nr:hypothetical protein [Candidatus Micrarchaeota archaeon]MDE1847976.1 hypothetical protein [Candidatus Micrarchaeota archaeon]MDE1864681.1 hypothetical protein [Candidatus Micrarchaeota archaeon]
MPDSDIITHYLSIWNKPTLVFAKEHGFRPFSLESSRANSEEVKSYLSKNKIDFIVFNGHGDKNTITGQNEKPIIIAGITHGLLKNKVVYAISCSSAKGLGPLCVKGGTISYIGYNEDFIFYRDANMMTKPLEDELAKLYLEHSSILINALLKGNKVKDAYQRAKENLRINLLKSYDLKDSSVAKYLWWDMEHFVYHGNGEALL